MIFDSNTFRKKFFHDNEKFLKQNPLISTRINGTL